MDSKLDKYFIFKCEKGLAERGLQGNSEYEDRLKFEISTILKMGFAGYFLIVADFLNWARSKRIPVGPGRGSAAGSLVAYCLGITNVNPLHYGLLFERFLNPDRVSMPDIDCDFCESRRDEVIEYVTKKYGQDHVAQIGTFGTMKARGAIRDVARTLGHGLQVSSKLADLIPPPVHGKPIPLATALVEIPELKAYRANVGSPESETLYWASRLENTIRSYGIHASGVVISPTPLHRVLPLALGKDGNQATQLDMGAVEDVGLIKFDFLGLRTLTMIRLCCDLIKKYHGVDIDPEALPLDDEKTFENLRSGDTCGIFQLETSSGIRDLMIRIVPRTLEDIIALVAMYRPGPLGSDGMQMYLDVRAGKKKPKYPFPELEPILKATSGWIIYQEQVMQIAGVLSGYTRGQTDDLRKAIGKKKEKDIEKHESIFIAGAEVKGHDKAKVAALYKNIKDFGAYGFNKSHAAAYGMITYQTAYLKAHYPVEFMAAALTCDYGNTSKVIKYISECKRLGITVLPPDVNESAADFTVIEATNQNSKSLGVIRFGLAAIKNLGPEPVSCINDARNNGYASLFHFCEVVDLGKINRKKLESLVLAGAFDSYGATRTSLLAAIDRVWEFRSELKKYDTKYDTFQRRVEACKVRDKEILDASLSGKKKPSKLKVPEEPIKPEPPVLPNLPEMNEEELLAYEKEMLGFYISGHPLDSYSSALKSGEYTSVDMLYETDSSGYPILPNDTFVQVPGVIGSIEERLTKKGDMMAYGSIEDRTGQVEMVVFAKTLAKCRDVLMKGRPLVLKGKLEVKSSNEDSDSEEAEVGILNRKIIVFDATELISGEIRYEPIDVVIQAKQSSKLLELLAKYPGEDFQVNVLMKIKDNSLFKVNKVFSIGGNKSAFLRDLGRIIA